MTAPSLGPLEREILCAIWNGGPTDAETLRRKLTRPLKDATVRTVLRRLEAKVYLTHETVGRTYRYRAVQARRAVAARATRRVLDGSAADPSKCCQTGS